MPSAAWLIVAAFGIAPLVAALSRAWDEEASHVRDDDASRVGAAPAAVPPSQGEARRIEGTAAGNRAAGRAGARELMVLALMALLVAIGAALFAGEMPWEAALLGWGLLALAAIDVRHGILPDALTLPLLLLGLALAAWREAAVPVDELVGAALGFAGFAAVASGYRLLRGREGLGLGDAKLLAAGGAWLGWAALPLVVCLAALSALAVVALRGKALRRDAEIRFGPYLCLGVWLLYLYDAARFGL